MLFARLYHQLVCSTDLLLKRQPTKDAVRLTLECAECGYQTPGWMLAKPKPLGLVERRDSLQHAA